MMAIIIMNAHELKQLQTRKSKLEAELKIKDIERRESAKAYDDLSAKLKKLEQEIQNFAKEPEVSEHALLRYIEREMGFDLDAIRAEILNAELKGMIKTLGGNGKFPIHKNAKHRAIVQNNVIVSIS